MAALSHCRKRWADTRGVYWKEGMLGCAGNQGKTYWAWCSRRILDFRGREEERDGGDGLEMQGWDRARGGVVTLWEGHGSVSRDARWRCHVGCHCRRHHGEDQPCSASRLWFSLLLKCSKLVKMSPCLQLDITISHRELSPEPRIAQSAAG